MEQEMDLLELLKVLLNKLWILLICMALGGLLAFSVSKFVIPCEYESNTTMYVMNYNAAYPDQYNGNDIDSGDLSTSKSLASTYITVLKSNAVMEEVGKRLKIEADSSKLKDVLAMTDGVIRKEAIRSSLTMSTVDDTEVIKIMARTQDPEISAQICNILADVAPTFLEAVVKAGSVEIIDRAVANESPVAPNILKNTLMGILIGLVLSAGVIILLYFLDDTVKDKEELSKKFNEPTLGEVQRIETEDHQKKRFSLPERNNKKNKRKKDESRSLLTDKHIPFNVKESYKTLRTNILFALSTSEKKVFAVSSVNPSEGKSTTAANIAIAFAQTGSRVLLIDADMRKPVLNKTFHVKNKEGLSTLIARTSDISGSVKPTSVDRLDLLPSGPIPPNPSELLASDRFKSLLAQFEQQYDYIILDTPPISIVTDAMVMKDAISGILLVLRYGSTKVQDIAECLKRFEFSEVNMLGFVLNDIQRKGGAGYYRSKKYGYGYGGRYGYGYEYGYGYNEAKAQMDEYIPDAEDTQDAPSEELNDEVTDQSTEIQQNPDRIGSETFDYEKTAEPVSKYNQVTQSEEIQDDRLSLSHTAGDRRRLQERGDVSGDDPDHEESGSEEDRSDTTLLRPQRDRYRSFS